MTTQEVAALKTRTIFRPFLLGTLALLAGSALVSYWLAGQSPYDINPVWTVWLPGLGAVLLAGLVLRPHLNILAVDRDKRGNPDRLKYGTFYIIGVATTVVTCLCISQFVNSTRSNLTALDTIAGLPGRPLTRFYSLHHPFVGITRAEVQAARGEGKSRSGYLYTYVCYPLLAAANDSAHALPVAWLARSYRISCPPGDGPDVERQSEQQWRLRFEQAAGSTADSLRSFTYLRLVSPDGNTQGFYQAVAHNRVYQLTNASQQLPVILQPVAADALGWSWAALAGALGCGAIGIGLFHGVLLNRPLRPTEEAEA